MNKAAVMLVPAALFAAAIWGIVHGIDLMVAEESNNKFHAMLLDCKYMGKSKDFDAVLFFDCNGRVELHKEIEWNTPH